MSNDADFLWSDMSWNSNADDNMPAVHRQTTLNVIKSCCTLAILTFIIIHCNLVECNWIFVETVSIIWLNFISNIINRIIIDFFQVIICVTTLFWFYLSRENHSIRHEMFNQCTLCQLTLKFIQAIISTLLDNWKPLKMLYVDGAENILYKIFFSFQVKWKDMTRRHRPEHWIKLNRFYGAFADEFIRPENISCHLNYIYR